MKSLFWIIGAAFTGYFVSHIRRDKRAQRGVKEMVSDQYGNYDLDGVSYDPSLNNVVVSGDGPVSVVEPALYRVQVLTALQCQDGSQPTARDEKTA